MSITRTEVPDFTAARKKLIEHIQTYLANGGSVLRLSQISGVSRSSITGLVCGGRNADTVEMFDRLRKVVAL